MPKLDLDKHRINPKTFIPNSREIPKFDVKRPNTIVSAAIGIRKIYLLRLMGQSGGYQISQMIETFSNIFAEVNAKSVAVAIG